MQNDTISRSALVAELEAFKMSLGDIVLRFVVDRVIELVKAQSGVEEAPAPEPEPEEKWCMDCIHMHLSICDEPCRSCEDHRRWEAAPDEAV